jgi:Zn-dependent metalloprotease
MNRVFAAGVAASALLVLWQPDSSAQRPPVVSVRATAISELRTWDAYVTQQARAGNLRLRRVDVDPALPRRAAERYRQYHGGVPIWGAEIVRDGERGVPEAIFGELAPELSLPTDATLSPNEARSRALQLGGGGATVLDDAELVIVPLESGEYRLGYTAVVSAFPDVFRVFLDAHSGAELRRYSELYFQQVIGVGQGLVGTRKKISVFQEGSTFFADDRFRPVTLRTLDARGNIQRAIAVLNGAPVAASERAQDGDNVWNEDVSALDAHVHIGWSYDYFFKRFGRRGLNNADLRTNTVINAATQQQAVTPGAIDPSLVGTFVFNAFWCPSCGEGRTGNIFFGNGIPPNAFLVSTGQNWAQLAGALDVVGHEYTHGITTYTSGLIPQNESGALNESFSDMMGTAIEFFYQPTGTGRGVADYRGAEDAVRGVTAAAIAADRHGLRSMDNPGLFGHPDHYSQRFLGPGDSGGIHINCGISNQAYYLAIEGGTNRTSGLAVQGVGTANREQIERVFFRGFTVYLTPNATFSTARAATIQAALDLFGDGSPPHRAVVQAWTAVGVL